MRKSFVLIFCALSAACGYAQEGGGLRELWSRPVAPFQIIGNVYYVGAHGVSSFLITTPEGHAIIDSGTTLMAPRIAANVEQLGFKVRDVKYLLATQAHWDHVEGHAELQRRTGAQVLAMKEDAEAIGTGTDRSALGAEGWEPVKVDRELQHGDAVTLGGVSLIAHHTPGHTQGCTTWTLETEHEGKALQVVFVGGTSVNLGVKLLNNARHPSIAEDYARAFAVLKALTPQVFLAQHPAMFGMEEKRARQQAGDATAFVDPEGYAAFVRQEEIRYETQLKREQARQ